jgi:hypothetical protein
MQNIWLLIDLAYETWQVSRYSEQAMIWATAES